jgi:hemerythrin
MPLIEWYPEYRTGIASLDHEHHEMIALLNEMAEAVLSEGAPEKVSAFLGEVYAKIQAHFALEERIMRAHSFADFPAHKADHERLLDELREIMESHEADAGFDYRGALSARLRDWFMVHFHEHDARLHSLMR